VNETFIHVTHKYLVSVDGVLDNPVKDNDWVITASHYILI